MMRFTTSALSPNADTGGAAATPIGSTEGHTLRRQPRRDHEGRGRHGARGQRCHEVRCLEADREIRELWRHY